MESSWSTFLSRAKRSRGTESSSESDVWDALLVPSEAEAKHLLWARGISKGNVLDGRPGQIQETRLAGFPLGAEAMGQDDIRIQSSLGPSAAADQRLYKSQGSPGIQCRYRGAFMASAKASKLRFAPLSLSVHHPQLRVLKFHFPTHWAIISA